MLFSVGPHRTLDSLDAWHLRPACNHMNPHYPELIVLLCEVYRFPFSTAEIELHQKMSKGVLSSRRGRTEEGKVELDIWVAHY